MKKYKVELSDEESAALRRLISRGRRGGTSARKVARARILLLAGEGASDTAIVTATGVGLKTVEQLRRRFSEERLGALNERPRSGRPANPPTDAGAAGRKARAHRRDRP